MAALALFASSTIIANTVSLATLERRRQIGIMKAIGGLRRQISTLYLSAIFVYGFMSLVIAVSLAASAFA